MAYNVLKGNVAGSVDQHADQEIDGVKVFKNTISASVFYDTDAQSPCATIKDVAITRIEGAARNSILTYNGGTTATANFSLVYDKNTLFTEKLVAKEIAGSGTKLINLPANKFINPINAEYINHGKGLTGVRGQIQAAIGAGLKFEDQSITPDLSVVGALNIKDEKIIVDPTRTDNLISSGQTLSDDDLIIVADVSKRKTNSVTVSQLYENYIDNKIAKPSGNKNEIQFKDRRKFSSSPKFTYDAAKSLLTNEGTLNTLNATVENSLTCNGAIYQNIKSISDVSVYEIGNLDHTVLVDTYKNSVTVKLPPAINNKGRVIVIKKANTDKYNIKSNIIKVESDGELIEQKEHITIKMNYSMRTLQSDGNSWWIVGTNGT